MTPAIQRWIGLSIALVAIIVCLYVTFTADLGSKEELVIPASSLVAVIGAVIAMFADARDESLDP